MSRWAADPEGAADELIRRSLDAIDLGGPTLLVNPSGSLPRLLAERSMACTVWNRRMQEGRAASPWPRRLPCAPPMRRTSPMRLFSPPKPH